MIGELVSIVVPVYNMGNSLEVCVNSLISQSYSNLEIILVDDGSKDNSLEVCNILKKKDGRIRVIHTENRGSGPARNTGIKNANGRYIYFPDADDYLEKNTISILVEAMSNGKYDLIVFGYKSIDKNGKLVLLKQYPKMEKKGSKIRQNYSDYVAASRKYGIQGAPWNKFFDLSLIKRNSIEYPSLRRHQDECFISRYMCYSQNVRFIDSVLYIHIMNDLKKEWDKYPIDYLESVIGLYNIKCETILSWNEDDLLTKTIINHEYICNVIKSLEMIYSPKMNFNKKSKLEWFYNQVQKSNIMNIQIPYTLQIYQRTILTLIRKNWIYLVLIIMKFKIEIEKIGLLSLLRKMKCN